MRNANKEEDPTLRDAAESISNDLESKIFKRFSASGEGSELNKKKEKIPRYIIIRIALRFCDF